jgi:hypothetical protein
MLLFKREGNYTVPGNSKYDSILQHSIFYKPVSNALEWTGKHAIHHTLPNSVCEIIIKIADSGFKQPNKNCNSHSETKSKSQEELKAFQSCVK